MINKGNLEIHGGNLRQAREKYSFTDREIVDFSANINPLGLSDKVRSAILANINEIVNYPDPEAKALKQALSTYYGLPVEQLVVGNGAAELMYVLTHHLRPRKVLIPAPSFAEYARAASSAKAEIIYLPLQPEHGFQIDVVQLIDALADVDMCFLCNPHNPVGGVMSKDMLETVVQAAAKQGVWVVIDESFMDFLPDSVLFTCRGLVAKYQNVIVVHSLTKFFALPGLRLGFGIMPEALAKAMDLAKDPWNVNNLAQAAGVAALDDTQYIQKSIEHMQEEQKFIYEALKRINGLTPYPPTANFIFLRIEHPQFDAGSFADVTARQGILIRDCSSYPGLDAHYLRVAVKLREDNLKLLAVFEALLGLRGEA